MKILLVNKFHYNRGGSETYYFGLDELLRSKGNEVIHFAMSDERNEFSPTKEFFVKNVDFNTTKGAWNKVRAAKNMFYSKEAYENMRSLLLKEKPDIVHIGLVHKQITYSILKAINEFNIPVVQIVHDLIFVCPCYTMFTNFHNCELCVNGSVLNCIRNKCVKGSTLKSLLAAIENRYIAHKKYYYNIDLFLTECNFYKNILEKAHITDSRIVNIPVFLPKSKKMVYSETAGEYFLYFGRFTQEKGILTLINAYSISGMNTKLILVGGGPYEEQVKKYIKEKQLNDRVKLAGYIYGEKMEELVLGAKAVIVPSELYENCPYSILEAMAKSRIVIASNIAGLPELVDDGVTGYLFTPQDTGDLSEKLLAVDNMGADEYKKMCSATYYRAKEMFDADSYYEKIIRIYNELIEKRRVSCKK